jgi:hypothetical protein
VANPKRNTIVACGVAATVLAALPTPARAETASVTIQVSTQRVSTSRPYIKAAERVAGAIYAGADIRVTWVDAAALPIDMAAEGIRARVLVISEDLAGQLLAGSGLGTNVLGITPTGTNRAYVMWERIAALATTSRQRIEVVLGRVLAHELGHALLALDGHSETGIMRAALDYASDIPPQFTAAQALTMRAHLMQRRDNAAPTMENPF